MPTYVYECQECGAEREAFNRVADCETHAPQCHGAMRIVPQAGMFTIRGAWENYQSPLSGRIVQSDRQRSEEMREFDVIDARELGDPKKRALDYLEKNKAKVALANSMPKPRPDFTPDEMR